MFQLAVRNWQLIRQYCYFGNNETLAAFFLFFCFPTNTAIGIYLRQLQTSFLTGCFQIEAIFSEDVVPDIFLVIPVN